jgi:hypothetical protein
VKPLPVCLRSPIKVTGSTGKIRFKPSVQATKGSLIQEAGSGI